MRAVSDVDEGDPDAVCPGRHGRPFPTAVTGVAAAAASAAWAALRGGRISPADVRRETMLCMSGNPVFICVPFQSMAFGGGAWAWAGPWGRARELSLPLILPPVLSFSFPFPFFSPLLHFLGLLSCPTIPCLTELSPVCPI